MTLEWLLITGLFIIVLLLLVKNHKVSRDKTEQAATVLFEEWKANELPKQRQQAIQTSQAVTMGKSMEHIIPYFSSFPYNPKDVRFLGSPIDFVVFDGLSEGELREVIFIEVKTGRKATLPSREKAVKNCINARSVRWELMHHQSAQRDG